MLRESFRKLQEFGHGPAGLKYEGYAGVHAMSRGRAGLYCTWKEGHGLCYRDTGPLPVKSPWRIRETVPMRRLQGRMDARRARYKEASVGNVETAVLLWRHLLLTHSVHPGQGGSFSNCRKEFLK